MMIRELWKTLKNPLVVSSLILGIAGAPPLFLSGIYMGDGQVGLGVGLFGIYVVIYTVDALVTLTLLIKR